MKLIILKYQENKTDVVRVEGKDWAPEHIQQIKATTHEKLEKSTLIITQPCQQGGVKTGLTPKAAVQSPSKNKPTPHRTRAQQSSDFIFIYYIDTIIYSSIVSIVTPSYAILDF